MTTQTNTVLKHLFRRGSISPMEAIISYGIMRLADNIYQLRNRGYGIITSMHKDESGHKYARYYMDHDRHDRAYKNGKVHRT